MPVWELCSYVSYVELCETNIYKYLQIFTNIYKYVHIANIAVCARFDFFSYVQQFKKKVNIDFTHSYPPHDQLVHFDSWWTQSLWAN